MNYQEKIQEKQKLGRQRKLRRLLKTAFISLGVAVAGGLGIWLLLRTSSVTEAELISRAGIHWHPELSITIKGTKQEIPANIGLGIAHNPIHTHDATCVIHLEFDGLVTKDSIRLEKFFKIWGKPFNKDCLLDYCNGPEGTMKMLVNGQPNAEFENYVMRD